MAVQVRLPTMLRKHARGKSIVEVSGETVGGLLRDLGERYPGLRDDITTSKGQLHQFVNVYVNDEDIRYLQKLDTPLHSGDVVSILPAVAGGVPDGRWRPMSWGR